MSQMKSWHPSSGVYEWRREKDGEERGTEHKSESVASLVCVRHCFKE